MSLHSVEEKSDELKRSPESGESWVDLLDTTDKGAVKSHVGNLQCILDNDPRWRNVLGYCEVSYRIIKLREPPMPNSTIGEWEDIVDPKI